jgi:FdhD protein
VQREAGGGNGYDPCDGQRHSDPLLRAAFFRHREKERSSRRESALTGNANNPGAGPLPAGAVRREVLRHRAGISARVADAVAEEIPVAFVYNERPHAVMLATPSDLEDFALGFSLSEAIIADAREFEGVEIAPALAGIELRIRVPEVRAAVLDQRVRQLTGRTGCGLCGAQTLDAAVRHPPPVADPMTIERAALHRALGELQRGQTINSVTGATHAAAWAMSDGRVVLVREDVGRHNALDKLIGAMQGEHLDSTRGFLVVTSRASYEMVMKSATIGIGIVAAISAPTALAIALAQEANVTLIGFARPDGYSIYSHAQRVDSAAQRNRSTAS